MTWRSLYWFAGTLRGIAEVRDRERRGSGRSDVMVTTLRHGVSFAFAPRDHGTLCWGSPIRLRLQLEALDSFSCKHVEDRPREQKTRPIKVHTCRSNSLCLCLSLSASVCLSACLPVCLEVFKGASLLKTVLSGKLN